MQDDAPANDARPKNVGSRVQRLEDPRLLTGAGGFVDDIQLAHTLHVAFVRSDHAHASILSIDADAASALPGVIGIYAAEDFPVKPTTMRWLSSGTKRRRSDQPQVVKFSRTPCTTCDTPRNSRVVALLYLPNRL